MREKFCGITLYADTGCLNKIKTSLGSIPLGNVSFVRFAKNIFSIQLALFLGHVFK